MNKYLSIGLVLAVVIVGGLLADWYASSVWDRQQAERELAGLEVRQAENDELAQGFEDVLNGLLDNVQAKVLAYKRARKVLTEIVQPVNLARLDNMDENIAMMDRIIPDLRGKMDGIMLAFETADGQVKALLNGVEAESQAKLLKTWTDTRSGYANDYLAFFELEEQVIDAHRALMAFYQQAAGQFVYAAETDLLVFEDENLRLLEADLKLDIKELAIRQAQLFVRRAEDKQAAQ